MLYIKKLPSNANYLYCTEVDSKVVKVYKNKHRIYLVTPFGILSYSPRDLQVLSSKLYDIYERLPNKSE